jgi:hypothetical protein
MIIWYLKVGLRETSREMSSGYKPVISPIPLECITFSLTIEQLTGNQ